MRRLLSNKKTQVLLNGGLGIGLLAVAVFSVRHFAGIGWPLHHADPWLVAASALLFLIAYAFKAWGWQRLFAKHDRPAAQALAFAGGAACVGGVALPGRVDDAVRIAVVKRYPGTRTGLGTLGLSLIVLGMLDNAALTPLASVAAADAHSWAVRAGFAVARRRGRRSPPSSSRCCPGSRAGAAWRTTALRAGSPASRTCRRRRCAAWLFISVSWMLRGTAVFLLLNALSLQGSFPLALAFVCASAASAALPIAPAGAATQAGAGAAILIASGVPAGEALAFSVAAQALVVVTGAAVMLLIAAWHFALHVRGPRVAARSARRDARQPRRSPSAARARRRDRAHERDDRRDEQDLVQPGDERARRLRRRAARGVVDLPEATPPSRATRHRCRRARAGSCSGRSRRARRSRSRSRPGGTCC